MNTKEFRNTKVISPMYIDLGLIPILSKQLYIIISAYVATNDYSEIDLNKTFIPLYRTEKMYSWIGNNNAVSSWYWNFHSLIFHSFCGGCTNLIFIGLRNRKAFESHMLQWAQPIINTKSYRFDLTNTLRFIVDTHTAA